MTDTSLTQTVRRARRESVSAGRLVRAGFVAAVGAMAANLLVYFLVPALFGFTLQFPLMGPGSPVQPLPAFMVLVATIVSTIGAVIVLALLVRFTARPARNFSIVVVALFVLSLGAPLSIAAPLAVRLTLVTMHVITAAIITAVLTRALRTS